MNHATSKIWRLSLMLAPLLLIASTALAVQEAEDPRDVKISKALKTPTNVQFINTPLHDVVVYLGDLRGIKIEVDKKALEKAMVPLDAPITKKASDVPFEKILSDILEPLKLDFIVKNHVLTFTTVDEAKEWKKRTAKR